MAYADPQSTSNPTTGQAILAAWGDIVRDDLEYLARNKPHCDVYSTATQTIASGIAEDVVFPSENYDVGGMHSTASNTDQVVVPTGEAGKYDIVGGTTFPADADGYRQVKLTKNGSDFTPAHLVLVPAVSGAGMAIQVVALAVSLAAGDIIRLQVLHSAGNDLAIDDSYLTVKWVGV